MRASSLADEDVIHGTASFPIGDARQTVLRNLAPAPLAGRPRTRGRAAARGPREPATDFGPERRRTDQPAEPPAPAQPSTGDARERRFFDTVTVSSTLNPLSLKETPSTVSVIDAETIDRRLVLNAADLVKFEPGVYIESNLTRVGLNGFNIRGIGGNRVMTLVDGVETAEQFDFGPFNAQQFQLDFDTLKSAEIVRSAGSSLYGSDALGGVVTLFTKDPADYLAGQRFHVGGKSVFDSRSSDAAGNLVVAAGTARVQASVSGSYANGREIRNRGRVRTEDATRTVANPQDRRNAQVMGKVVMHLGVGHVLRATAEVADNDIATEGFASRGRLQLGQTAVLVSDIDSRDLQRRFRLSVDHRLENRGGLNSWFWNLYVQESESNQVVDEVRTSTGVGPAVTARRRGTLDFEQAGWGGALQGRKLVMPRGQAVLVTFGGSYKHNTFDMIRDRRDVNQATGAVIPATDVIPTKYFPRSDVDEAGAYLQAEMSLGRLTLVPGVRFDRFRMDGDETDRVFLASLSPVPADFSDGAVSTRLGASVRVSNAVTVTGQYAGGFRAPPYSAINSGFTNLAGGYTTLPNAGLRAETSDNLELGLRSVRAGSLGVTGFANFYRDFIQQVALGFNPATRLLEFRNENVTSARIAGIELRGEMAFSPSWRLRGAYAAIRGDDTAGPTERPLGTVAPDQGTLGLEYAPASGRWGSELILRAAAGQPQERAVNNATPFYAPEAFATLDLLGWFNLGPMKVRAGVLNATNAKFFEWPNVRGRPVDDPVIDRFSSPGIAVVLSAGYRW